MKIYAYNKYNNTVEEAIVERETKLLYFINVEEFRARTTFGARSAFGYKTQIRKDDPSISLTKLDAIKKAIKELENNINRHKAAMEREEDSIIALAALAVEEWVE